jgi:hypothetical protein
MPGKASAPATTLQRRLGLNKRRVEEVVVGVVTGRREVFHHHYPTNKSGAEYAE